MLVGINCPWINYGWDFGDPPRAWVAGENLPAWREAKRKQIEGKGYPACFMWSAKAMDPATRWTEEAHREILTYGGLNQA
jgi:hypothetical protein